MLSQVVLKLCIYEYRLQSYAAALLEMLSTSVFSAITDWGVIVDPGYLVISQDLDRSRASAKISLAFSCTIACWLFARMAQTISPQLRREAGSPLLEAEAAAEQLSPVRTWTGALLVETLMSSSASLRAAVGSTMVCLSFCSDFIRVIIRTTSKVDSWWVSLLLDCVSLIYVWVRLQNWM